MKNGIKREKEFSGKSVGIQVRRKHNEALERIYYHYSFSTTSTSEIKKGFCSKHLELIEN